jgi:hypothetical protein
METTTLSSASGNRMSTVDLNSALALIALITQSSNRAGVMNLGMSALS